MNGLVLHNYSCNSSSTVCYLFALIDFEKKLKNKALFVLTWNFCSNPRRIANKFINICYVNTWKRTRVVVVVQFDLNFFTLAFLARRRNFLMTCKHVFLLNNTSMSFECEIFCCTFPQQTQNETNESNYVAILL